MYKKASNIKLVDESHTSAHANALHKPKSPPLIDEQRGGKSPSIKKGTSTLT